MLSYCILNTQFLLQVQNRRKSYTSSSSQKRDVRDLENRLNNVLDLENNHHHKHGGMRSMRNQSLNTSSTKLTQSVSPLGNWRTRNNFLAARAHEQLAFNYKSAMTKEEILERKREGRLLNQIDEEKTGIQREASSSSTYKANQYHSKQTSSYPTLLFNKPTIYEKVNTRCTSVWTIKTPF